MPQTADTVHSNLEGSRIMKIVSTNPMVSPRTEQPVGILQYPVGSMGHHRAAGPGMGPAMLEGSTGSQRTAALSGTNHKFLLKLLLTLEVTSQSGKWTLIYQWK